MGLHKGQTNSGSFKKGENLGNQSAKGNKPNQTSFKKGEHKSSATEFKKGIPNYNIRDEKHPMWKGDNAIRESKHKWLILRFGKAKNYKCLFCDKQAYGWSNIDHKYTRHIEDYRPLCASCHLKWDYKYNKRGKRGIKYDK